MSSRHHYDEFIWALIFSLGINVLIVFALLGQRWVKNSPGLQPFVVSIAVSPSAPPGKSSARLEPAKKKALTSPPLQALDTSVPPPLPTENPRVEEPVASEIAGVRAGGEISPVGAENATATIGKESAAGLSIFEDKISAGNYTAPEYLTGEKPPYPQRAARNGWEGTVLLTLLINANGEVEQVGIAKTSGYELLDRQACESVGAWRFKPARRNGLAIATTVQQPIIFRPTPPETFR